MQAKFLTQLGAGEASASKDGEKPKLDGGQQDFGIPKAKSGLQNGIGRRRLIHKDREAGRPGIPLASAKFVVRVCCSADVGGRDGKNTNSERSDWCTRQRRVARNLKAGIGSSPRPNDACQVCHFPTRK